jgi:magnesium-transporting ATPase (P-type)
MIDLTVQMGVIFIARAIVRHMLNYLEPVFTRFFEGMKYNGVKDGFNSIGSKYSYKPSDNSNIPQLYSDMALTSVDHWNTYLDGYESATVQFGFIVLFSTAFPLAPLLATIHNIIQWRIDAYNLLYRYKRPFARQAANIGVWEDWVLTLAYLGIAMNALILSFTSEWLLNNIDSFSTKSGNEQWLIRTAFVIIFEHSVLLAYFLVKKLVRSTPQRAINSLKRQAYIEKLLSGEIR